jgi:hypothetical protein
MDLTSSAFLAVAAGVELVGVELPAFVGSGLSLCGSCCVA